MRSRAVICFLALVGACSQAEATDGDDASEADESSVDADSASSESSPASDSASESAGDGDGDLETGGDGDGDGDGEMSWRGAELLETTPSHAAAQALVAGPEGDALALWHQNDAFGVRQLHGAFFDAQDGSWDLPQVIHGESESVGTARGAVDGQGNAWVAWIQSTGAANSLILASRYDAGEGQWSPPDLLADDGLAHTGLSVVIDGQGHAHVSWVGYNPIGVFIEYELTSRREVSGGWGEASSLELSPALVRSPSIAIDAQGQPLAAWSGESVAGVEEIHLARYDFSTQSWGFESQLALPFDEAASHLKLRVGSEGSEWLLFRAGLSSYNDLSVVHRDAPGTAFSSPQVLDVGDARPEDSSLVLADDYAFVLWTQDDGSDHFPVFARHYDMATRSWSEALVLDPNPAPDTPASFSLGTSADGRAVAVYQVAPLDGVDGCWARHFSPQSTNWGPPHPLEEGDFDADSPVVLVDELGRAIAMWDQDDGDEIDSMWANRYE